MQLIEVQYLTTRMFDIHYKIGEEIVIDFLNRYFHWYFEEKENMTIKMEVGDPYPRFMHYHPEEMGFGGPDVWSEWNEMGWIMEFIPQKTYPGRETNIDILRFLAMRRAGYPVLYRPYD